MAHTKTSAIIFNFMAVEDKAEEEVRLAIKKVWEIPRPEMSLDMLLRTRDYINDLINQKIEIISKEKK